MPLHVEFFFFLFFRMVFGFIYIKYLQILDFNLFFVVEWSRLLTVLPVEQVHMVKKESLEVFQAIGRI